MHIIGNTAETYTRVTRILLAMVKGLIGFMHRHSFIYQTLFILVDFIAVSKKSSMDL